MLNYLITVTEDLLIVTTILTLLYAATGMIWKNRGLMVLRVGMIVGAVASVAMSIAKNTTSKIATNQWNEGIFLLTIVGSSLFVFFSLIVAGGKRQRDFLKGGLLCPVLASFLAALLIFYKMPDLIAYPFLFNTGEDGVLSMAFLVRLAGWLLGILIQFVYCWYLYRCVLSLDGVTFTLVILNADVLINLVRCMGQALRPWLTRAKFMPDFIPAYSKAEYPWAFPIAKFVANNTLLFMFSIAGLALLIPIVLFLRNLKVKETWENPAQHRKLRANCRRCRHASETVAVCFVLCLLTMTAVKAYDSREVPLSEPETYAVEDDQVYIDLSQVDDGHLHRFEYTTENGVDVRWIVIRKPDSAAYGVGLDACEICGDAGYYERSGQVVCKRCDVVMNINTIGFSGGCNPIPLDFRIENGQMIFSLDDIIAGEQKFK